MRGKQKNGKARNAPSQGSVVYPSKKNGSNGLPLEERRQVVVLGTKTL